MTDAGQPAIDDRYAAFRHVAFVRYWVSRFLVNFSTQVLSVAVGWQIYDLTRDPFDLGLIGLMQFLPSLLLVLVTGAAADRYGRRLIMAISAALLAACTLAMLWLSFDGLVTPLPVFAILLLVGIGRAFFAPASSAIVANLVPTEDFANAIAWNSSAWQLATVLGPVAGGLLYGVTAETAYAVAALFLCAAVALTLAIPKPEGQAASRRVTLDSLFGGFRYIWREKVVLGAITLDLFAVLLGGAVALLPVYARDILELGPWGLGLLRAAPGIGAILTAMWLAGHPVREHAGLIMFAFVGLFGVFTALFGVSTIPWLSILALALIGAADMVSVVIRETLIQLWTPDALRGRVNAVNMLFIGASNELGEFRAGTMAAVIGTVPAVLFGGVGAVAIAIGWALMFPQLRRTQHLEGRD